MAVNRSIKVPQSVIDKLKAGGTKATNVKRYTNTKSAVIREAMNRYYGSGWDATPPTKRSNYGPGKIPKAKKSAPGDSNYGAGKIPLAGKKVKEKTYAKPKAKNPGGKNIKPNYGPGKIPSAARNRYTGRGN